MSLPTSTTAAKSKAAAKQVPLVISTTRSPSSNSERDECARAAEVHAKETEELWRLYRIANDTVMGENGVQRDEVYACRLLHSLVERGHAPSLLSLGFCYNAGSGVEKDEVKAAELFQEAADQGIVEAQFNLAVCYERGRGVAVDDARAVALYQQAADKGDLDALCNLGTMVRDGRGVACDEQRAFHMLKRAADQGHPLATNNLGNCYYQGRGVLLDYKRAAELYQIAANLGVAEAQYAMSVCLIHGHGVEQNVELAMRLCQKAADAGSDEAIKTLPVMKAKYLVLRSCFNCAVVEVTADSHKQCAACRAAYYCNAECQRAHWKATHKADCKRLAQETADKFRTIVKVPDIVPQQQKSHGNCRGCASCRS